MLIVDELMMWAIFIQSTYLILCLYNLAAAVISAPKDKPRKQERDKGWESVPSSYNTILFFDS